MKQQGWTGQAARKSLIGGWQHSGGPFVILFLALNIVIINISAPMRRCGDRLVFANCRGQSLKRVPRLAHPSFAHNIAIHCHSIATRLPHTWYTLHCHTYHTPPKIRLHPRTTCESVLHLQPFIVATITQWVFSDWLTNEMKSHFVLLLIHMYA